MSANDKQVGGNHYQSPIQHWDYVIAYDLDYFQAQVIKYMTRWKRKGGPPDLYKARHFLEKYIEHVEQSLEKMRLEAEARAAEAAASTAPIVVGDNDTIAGPTVSLDTQDPVEPTDEQKQFFFATGQANHPA